MPLIVRPKMPVSVQIRPRPAPDSARLPLHHTYLQLRLSVQGQRDAGFLVRPRRQHPATGAVSFGELLVIDARRWVKRTHQLRGRDLPTLEINETLARLKSDAKAILLRQEERYHALNGAKPTLESVKYEYQTGLYPELTPAGDGFLYPPDYLQRKAKTTRPDRMPQPSRASLPTGRTVLSADSTLLDAFAAYLIDLKVRGSLSAATIEGKRCAYNYLKRFPPAQTVLVSELTSYWVGDVFHAWLLRQPAGNQAHKHLGKLMKPGTATTYCWAISHLLDWMKRQRLIQINPLSDMDLPTGRTKPIFALTDEQWDRLFTLQVPPSRALTLWWFKLMCVTGMDYEDAVRYAEAPDPYHQRTPKGKLKIVIRRGKKPHNECHIPVTAELLELWDEVAGQAPHVLSDTTLITHLSDIARWIGFREKLTPKVARKTCGTRLLKNHSIQFVSKVLGHTKIHTTENFYARTTGDLVNYELDKEL